MSCFLCRVDIEVPRYCNPSFICDDFILRFTGDKLIYSDKFWQSSVERKYQRHLRVGSQRDEKALANLAKITRTKMK